MFEFLLLKIFDIVGSKTEQAKNSTFGTKQIFIEYVRFPWSCPLTCQLSKTK